MYMPLLTSPIDQRIGTNRSVTPRLTSTSSSSAPSRYGRTHRRQRANIHQRAEPTLTSPPSNNHQPTISPDTAAGHGHDPRLALPHAQARHPGRVHRLGRRRGHHLRPRQRACPCPVGVVVDVGWGWGACVGCRPNVHTNLITSPKPLPRSPCPHRHHHNNRSNATMSWTRPCAASAWTTPPCPTPPPWRRSVPCPHVHI